MNNKTFNTEGLSPWQSKNNFYEKNTTSYHWDNAGGNKPACAVKKRN